MATWRPSEPQSSTEVPTGATYIVDNWTQIQAVLGSTKLTNGTAIPDYIPSGTKMWFYADTAPVGWTLDATPSDSLLAVKGGSTYTTGATQAGTWTQPDHTLDITEIPDHTHSTGASTSANSGGGATIYVFSSSNPATGATLSSGSANSAHNHGSAYRNQANVGIICSRDA
jgi:hypothetical protein